MTNNNNNLIPKENYKQFEEVREIKNEIPTFEEFMKTYEADGKVNYDDLTFSDISDKDKGYGPCPDGCERKVINGKEVHATYQNLKTSGPVISDNFSLNIECYNWIGDGASRWAYSTSQALQYADNLDNNNWYAANVISDEVLHKCASLVRGAVRHYNSGKKVNGRVRVRGKFWGGGYEYYQCY